MFATLTEGMRTMRSDGGSLPARNTLPGDVDIPVLPGLGLTWYDRGTSYWVRRVGLSLMWLIALTVIAGIDTGLFGAMRQSSQTGFDVFILIDATLSAALLVWAAVRTVRRWNVARPPARLVQPVFRFGPGPAARLLSGLAQFGYWLLILVVAFALLVFPGLFIALFLTSLLPETLDERQARLWLIKRLHQSGLVPQTGDHGPVTRQLSAGRPPGWSAQSADPPAGCATWPSGA